MSEQNNSPKQATEGPKTIPLLDRIMAGETTTIDGNPITRDAIIAEFASPKALLAENQALLNDPEKADWYRKVLGIDPKGVLGDDSKLSPEEAFNATILMFNHLATNGFISPPQEGLLRKFGDELEGFSGAEIDALTAASQAGRNGILEGITKSDFEYYREKNGSCLEDRPHVMPDVDGLTPEELDRDQGDGNGVGIFYTPPKRDPAIPHPGIYVDPEQIRDNRDAAITVCRDIQPISEKFNTGSTVPDNVLACAAEGVGEPVGAGDAEGVVSVGPVVKNFTA